jgi:hypothetical protein
MRIPKSWAEWIAAKLEARVLRQYEHLVGYMLRWWVVGGPDSWLRVRMHAILRSDRDRALHDHPATSVSLILRGGYWEVMEYVAKDKMDLADYRNQLGLLPYVSPACAFIMADFNIKWRAPGDIVIRRATDAHRIVLPKGRTSLSLFAMTRTTNAWGFYPGLEENGKTRKVAWQEYLGKL